MRAGGGDNNVDDNANVVCNWDDFLDKDFKRKFCRSVCVCLTLLHLASALTHPVTQ